MARMFQDGGSICPEVFGWPSKEERAPEGVTPFVKEGAERFFVSHEQKVREACIACPVGVISVEEK